MPSRVVTKRRVKRRQQRLVSKNAKRNARSVRKHRKTAKKVMRGGLDLGNYDIEMDPIEIKSTGPSVLENSVYVLYDSIKTHHNNNVSYNNSPNYKTMNIPICVIFFEHKMPKDNIYLFFHHDVTGPETTLAVKLLLGIEEGKPFELSPAIEFADTETYNWGEAGRTIFRNLSNAKEFDLQGAPNQFMKLLGKRFVKLTQCGVVSEYCIETGTFDDSRSVLNEVKTTKHEINGTKPGRWWDGNSVKKLLYKNEKGRREFGFADQVIQSKALLPDLYLKYKPHYERRNTFIPKSPYRFSHDRDFSAERPLKTTDFAINVYYYRKLKVQDIIDSIIEQSPDETFTGTLRNKEMGEINTFTGAEEAMKIPMTHDEIEAWRATMEQTKLAYNAYQMELDKQIKERQTKPLWAK